MANSTDDKKLINAGSLALHGVDHSTGKFCSFISIAQLIGNNGLGPSLDLKLYYTPHIKDDYFGNWRFGFNCATVYNTLASRAEILLESGQVIKWDGRSEATLPNTLIKVQSNNLHIIQSNGRREVLSPFPDPLDKHLISYLPTKIISESGHELTLDWALPTTSFPVLPAGSLQLISIRDESKTLFTATYATNTQPSSITLNVWPGTSSNYNYILDLSTSSVPGAPQTIKTLDKAVRSDSSDTLEFSYIRLARPNPPYPDGTPRDPTALAFHNKIKHGNRFSESITYNEEKVSSHTIEDINLVSVQNNTYTYKSIKGDFITSVNSIDNTTIDYRFTTDRLPIKETVWSNGNLIKITEVSRFSKNGNTVLSGKAGEPEPDRLEAITTTTYFNASLQTRSETSIITLDNFGNIIAKTENNITTEWTYYRGLGLTETRLVKIETIHTPTRPMSIVAGILDYANPVGWGFLLFAKAGLTWGTREIRQNVTSPHQTQHAKTTFNLPIVIECPGDPNYFKVHIETEKTYTLTNGKRTDLEWTFYSYSKLPVKGNRVNGPTLTPEKKLTIYMPDTDSSGKLSTAPGVKMRMILEENTYDTNIASPNHGRLLTSKQSILGGNGSKVAGSDVTTTLGYSLSGDTLTKTSTVTAGTIPPVINIQKNNIYTGLLLEEIDPQENKTSYAYDAQQRLIQHIQYADEASLRGVTTFTYLDSPSETTVIQTSPLGEQSKDVFDMFGRPLRNEWMQPDGSWLKLYEITYDTQGRQSSSTQYDYYPDKTPLPSQTRHFSYDEWGLSQIKSANSGETENFSYDAVFRKTTSWLSDGSETKSKSTFYFDEPGGESRQEQFVYVNDQWIKTQTRRYDALGRLIMESSTETPASHRTYDVFGRMNSLTMNGVNTINDYSSHTRANVATGAEIKSGANTVSLGRQTVDGLGRVTARVIGGTQVNYTYLGTGNWGKADKQHTSLLSRPSSIKLSDSWDPQTRTITETLTETTPQGTSTIKAQASYVYSIQGLPLQETDAFGNRTDYSYGTDGRLKRCSSATATTDFKYGPFGRLISETLTDLVTSHTMVTTYTYNALGQEIERQFSATGFAPLTLKTSYDTTMIASMEILQGATSLRKEQFNYDAKGQLEKYQCSGAHKPRTVDNLIIEKQEFTYDIAGNLVECKNTGNNLTTIDQYTYGAADPCQLQSITRLRYPLQEKLNYQYDSLGFLTNDNGVQLSYNMAGRLTQRSSQQNLDYYYDNMGKLTGCASNSYSVQYYYKSDFQYARKGHFIANGLTHNRSSVLINQSPSCLLMQETVQQGASSPIVSHSFELKDVKGSVIASYDLTSKTVTFFSYTAFGYRPHSVDQRSWVGFNGEPIDDGTATYSLGNGVRVYNPARQLFDTPDMLSPFGAGGSHRYRYCHNDPVNYSDPSAFAEVSNPYAVVTHSPAIEDPVVEATVLAVIGVALAPFTGGASTGWTATAVGLAVVSGSFGIASAAVAKNDPDLSEVLGWAALGTGLLEVGLNARLALNGSKAIARSTTSTKNHLIDRESSLVSKHLTIPRGQKDTLSVNVKSRNVLDNGKVKYDIYSAGPNTKKAIIDAHGRPRGEKFRFDIPEGIDFQFFAIKGAEGGSSDARFSRQLSGRLQGDYISKVHNSSYAKKTIDYLLAEFGPKDLLKSNIISNTQDVDTVMTALAKAHNIDIIRPKGQIPLSELLSAISNQNYSNVYGSFCRGPIDKSLTQAQVKALRNKPSP